MKLKHNLIQRIQQLNNHAAVRFNLLKLNRNLKITHSFSLFSFIFSQLNLNPEDSASNLTHISYGFFLLSIVAIFCFFNIVCFMITYILIQEGNYEKKYPKLRIFIDYYKKTTLVYVAIEVLLCLSCLILLVFFSLSLVYYGIT
jgi:hypothetical protein